MTNVMDTSTGMGTATEGTATGMWTSAITMGTILLY